MLYIVDLESIESRYTWYWETTIPKLMKDNDIPCKIISGDNLSTQELKNGAFLNFAATNAYKANQVEVISYLFDDGRIKKGDKFLFLDAWHPGIINLKYMSTLLNIPVSIYALWHAGNYDKNDFLGRIENNEWIKHFERSLVSAIDYNYFATKYHIEIFVKQYPEFENKCIRSGFPFEYIEEIVKDYDLTKKEDIIVFPHRLAEEKQLWVFKELERMLPRYKFVVAQEHNLSKDEYYKLLAKAKVVFSANLQETLGISMYESIVFGCHATVPDRLSYSEMDYLKYNPMWTDGTQKNNLFALARHIDILMNTDTFVKIDTLRDNYFTAKKLIEDLKELP